MFKINRIRTEIITTDDLTNGNQYGFDYNFDKGLNVVAGVNSRGKTTINTCIYFALGMEELLGAQNEKALDKSLKDNFTTNYQGGSESISHNIISSKVLLEVENEDGNATIIRYIKSDTEENTNKVAYVYDGGMDSLGDTNQEKYYIRGGGNNENENGYYNWLADFIKIVLPTVSNTSRKDNYSPLYLQIIFSSLFIEQTKGWSDFFATMPYFGIPRAKQKIFEFLLKLNELEISTKKDIISKKNKFLSEKWKGCIKSLELVSSEYGGIVYNLPEELTVEKNEADKIKIAFKINLEEEESLNGIIKVNQEKLEVLQNKPIQKIKEKNPLIVENYENQKIEYYELKEYISGYDKKLNLEKLQFDNLELQKTNIEKEIKEHNSLIKVFDERILNSRGENYCPTCTQSVALDLISNKNITIPKLSLEENIAFLTGQKKLIETSVKSLKNVISEKENLLKYFKNSLRKKEEVIKSISKDLIADDRDFSETDVLNRVQVEQYLKDLLFVQGKINEIKDELKELSGKYQKNISNLEELKKDETEDETKILGFETLYKGFLFDFGYESNERWRVSVSRKEPFKYFPVYKKFKDDIPQSIRVNSSASDFVRNVWAYSLSLLKEGNNHPGVLIFDEPGQHRTNIASLKSLFKSCSLEKNKQVIIFTSIDKKINEDEKIDIDLLVEGLSDENYKLIKLDNNNKVIQKLT